MLINLYGNVINPINITSVIVFAGNYIIFGNGAFKPNQDAPYALEIQPEIIQQIDGSSFHEPNVIFMMNMINKLTSLETTSAESKDEEREE